MHPSLNEPASTLEQCSIKFMLAVKSALISDGRSAIENQFSFMNLSDMAMHIYALNSVVARTSRAYSIGLKYSNHELNLAFMQCNQSSNRINESFQRIITSKNGMGIENLRMTVAEHIFRSNGQSTIHSLSRNY